MNILIITIIISASLIGCNQQANLENQDTTATEKVAATPDDTHSLTGSEGNKLVISFDNAKNIITISFKGETAELAGQKPASGIWYKNDQYELRGKGNDIELTKDGKTIFAHEDDKVAVEAKNDKGDVLAITFNNTAGTVKAYLNGGEQIDLTKKKTASGIWYKNDQYELRGKGKKYELTKDGRAVFKN